MRPKPLLRFLFAFAFALAIGAIVVANVFSVHAGEGEIVASLWRHGELVERRVLPRGTTASPWTTAPEDHVVFESIDAEGPFLAHPEIVFALSFVSGRDGVKATLGSATAYVTPDDLLARQAYDRGARIESLGALGVGVDAPLILALLGERLHASPVDVLEKATLRRVRVTRHALDAPPPRDVTATNLTRDDVRTAASEAAAYLARGVNEEGRFRYLVDAPTNRSLAGYDWPRHAGATYFLAQGAKLTSDPTIKAAALRAAGRMRDHALERCGDDPCVAVDNMAEIGSSALATIAFVEIARTGLDPSYRDVVVDLSRFLRAQQRPDGEFQHQYDRAAQRRVDVQFLYFSGEATLALARAFALTGDPADKDAASRALDHLTGPAWSFFGDRYYWSEEHWTCQAMADLWSAAPSPKALDFCLRWQEFNRHMQHVAGDSLYDSEGAFSPDPILIPRLTPVASRSEAAVATLDIARRANVDPKEIAALELELRRALSLLVRKQFLPGPVHLFADPEAVRGAIPGSECDWQLRIDYAQHAGSAMVRWLDVTAPPTSPAP